MKICRQIVAESDGWNWKDDPMAFRQGLLLKDMSSTPPEGKLFPWFLLICCALQMNQVSFWNFWLNITKCFLFNGKSGSVAGGSSRH